MNELELKEFLRDNLKIRLSHVKSLQYGVQATRKLQLVLGDEVISEIKYIDSIKY